jgi:hypothetical protein
MPDGRIAEQPIDLTWEEIAYRFSMGANIVHPMA